MTVSQSKDVATCCANFYEQDWVQDLLGESFHPGGLDLSARLIHSLNLPVDGRTLDVACGIGTTTLMMARQFGLDSVGLDFSQANVDKAIQSAGRTPPILSEFIVVQQRICRFPILHLTLSFANVPSARFRIR